MQKAEQIQLEFRSAEHLPILNEFELPDDQVQFTAHPKEALNLVEGQFPIVILADDHPVGFFILHATERVKEYTSNSHAMLLTTLSIDHRQQRKGYARRGMLALPSFIRSQFPSCDEVVLVVNHKNVPAQQLYERVGFEDTGRRRMGPIGEQWVMNITI
ncbi:GNAT family N-acetyltransferase [Paenibacillus lautus]|jgi:ribosomal protein S18 acetylase RimI-like enzyme|uniref:GNAT family N-acetyltransferase n=1 Tax=Paenibacillus lautus TaxID=1401 RepID=UPI000FD923B7|nr:GNAT family N-acetyltransferase [Paenibacillus lautus]